MSPAPLRIFMLPDPISHAKATASGIVYQDNYTRRDKTDLNAHCKWGTVHAVGDECDPKIKPGMRACYNPFDADELEDPIDGTLYEVIPMIGMRMIIDKS